MAAQAAFQIKPGLRAVLAAVGRHPSGPEVSGGKHIVLTVTLVAELPLFVAGRTSHIRQVRILTVAGDVIARMREEHLIARVARLTFHDVGTPVALIALLLFGHRGRRPVAIQPVRQVILRLPRII